MAEKKPLDLDRIYVFTTADNHFFRPAANVEMAVLSHGGQVAGVQPSFGVDGAGGALGFTIITTHNQVPTGVELAGLADRHGFSRDWAYNLDLGVWAGASNGGRALFESVAHPVHGDDRRSLRLAVNNIDFLAMHRGVHPLEELDRTWRASNHRFAQRAQIETRELRMLQ